LPSEQTRIKYKQQNRTLSISSIKKKTREKSQIPYDYKVGDQVLLETPGPRTGPYPIMNVYKNGTIRIQKDIKELYQKE
jgi:hypothetical protein